MKTACKGRNASRESIVEVMKIQPLRFSCPFGETNLFLTVGRIWKQSQGLTKVRKYSENTRSLSMSISWNQVSMLRTGNDHVDRFCTPERSDQLLRRRLELQHPAEYCARCFEEKSGCGGLAQFGLSGQETLSN